MTIGIVYADIRNGTYGNTKESSSFGLPGSGLTSAYMRCEFGVKITVEDDLGAYCSINGGQLTQTDIVGSSFPSWLWCEDHAWEGEINNDNKQDWMNDPQCFYRFTQTKDAAKGQLQYSFPGAGSDRGVYIGQLTNFVWESETSGTGYVWIGGSAIYDSSSITDPIYVVGLKVPVPGLRELLNYYPWAIRKGQSYVSCNRAGGLVQARKGGSWVDRKNTQSADFSKSTVFQRKSGIWTPSPKF